MLLDVIQKSIVLCANTSFTVFNVFLFQFIVEAFDDKTHLKLNLY